MKLRTYQIKEVADLAGVSARTLRHYDEVGLLKPSHRSASGYRLYGDADLLRLQQIMIGRSLGLALEDIRRSLDDPNLDPEALLREQRAALVARARATADMIRSIDAAIELLHPPSIEESSVNMKAIFDGFDPSQYEVETKQRWGTTDAYAESARRTQRYATDDWIRIKEESNQILKCAVELMISGATAGSDAAIEVAERYRQWVDRWFYPCDLRMHAGLADLYESDPRFAQSFDDRCKGLAAFLSAAIRANAQRS
jgi:DNA-binding transcriptional MerR regulator